MTEFYPTQHDILSCLGDQAIIVGSFAKNPESKPKDIDIVVSEEGLERLLDLYGYYLHPEIESYGWWLYIPMDEDEPVIEIFRDKAPIRNRGRWDSRLTYEEAIDLPLKTISKYGLEIQAVN